MSVEMSFFLKPFSSVLEEVENTINSGTRSFGSGAMALTLFALFMLISSTMAATTVAPSPAFSFVLPWKRAESAPRGATSWYKGWSGLRVPPGPNGDRTVVTMVYYHEQTIAVVELGKGKTLRNCELIEVYDALEISDALKNLTSIGKPFEISFSDMMSLMSQCHQLHTPGLELRPEARLIGRGARGVPRGLIGNAVANPSAIFNGIVPGTKWCGTGDIAATYYDLGPEQDLDRCCRTHDLCPVKVRAYQTRYNLTNAAIFSKSHCDCDDALFRCLKNAKSPTADVMGNIYFNIVQVPCLEHVEAPAQPSGRQGKEAMRFSPQHYAY